MLRLGNISKGYKEVRLKKALLWEKEGLKDIEFKISKPKETLPTQVGVLDDTDLEEINWIGSEWPRKEIKVIWLIWEGDNDSWGIRGWPNKDKKKW